MQIRDWMVESATRHAADYIVTFVGGMCQKMDREEGSIMVDYLNRCKTEMNKRLDSAIEIFSKWS